MLKASYHSRLSLPLCRARHRRCQPWSPCLLSRAAMCAKSAGGSQMMATGRLPRRWVTATNTKWQWPKARGRWIRMEKNREESAREDTGWCQTTTGTCRRCMRSERRTQSTEKAERHEIHGPVECGHGSDELLPPPARAACSSMYDLS